MTDERGNREEPAKIQPSCRAVSGGGEPSKVSPDSSSSSAISSGASDGEGDRSGLPSDRRIKSGKGKATEDWIEV
jgi:hypothetical protein